MPGSSDYDASGGVQDPAATGPRGPGPHDQIPPNKPPWFDQPHPVAPWGQQQVFLLLWHFDHLGFSVTGPHFPVSAGKVHRVKYRRVFPFLPSFDWSN